MQTSTEKVMEWLSGNILLNIPIYQRKYGWTEVQCNRLFEDLLMLIKNKKNNTHFLGIITYMEEEEDGNTVYDLIDGQQRVTTIELIIAAMRYLLQIGYTNNGSLKESKIKRYLFYDEDESNIKLKLILCHEDMEYYNLVINNPDALKNNKSSRIYNNYLLFIELIKKNDVNLANLLEALKKLNIVKIKLQEHVDDPQTVFETLNSTGLKLNETDKIKNLILMDEKIENKKYLYKTYWKYIEKNCEKSPDDFFKIYLSVKTSKIPQMSNIYNEFSIYFKNYKLKNKEKTHIEMMKVFLNDITKFSNLYNDIYIKSNYKETSLREKLNNINDLNVGVLQPYILSLMMDYQNEILNKKVVEQALDIIESYIVRRIFCFEAPTNALKTIFLGLHEKILAIVKKDIDIEYIEILKFMLINKQNNTKGIFPDNNSLKDKFAIKPIYEIQNPRRTRLILEKIEKFSNRYSTDMEDMTVEHIMPQNLTQNWKDELGSNAEVIYIKYLHTIGNLTLMKNVDNAKNQNLPFKNKKDNIIESKADKLFLNENLIKYANWTETEILDRADMLFEIVKKVWPYPGKSTISLSGYNNDIEFSLSDYESYNLFNTTLKKVDFLGEIIDNKDWTSITRIIVDQLYKKDPDKIERLVKIEKPAISSLLTIKSRDKSDIIIKGKTTEIYVNTHSNTQQKLRSLLAIIDYFDDIDPDDIIFYAKIKNKQ